MSSLGAMAILLLIGAVVIGLMAWYAMQSRVRSSWLWTSIAALVGGYIGSELIRPASAHGPVIDGLHVLPGFVGAVLISAALEFVFRSAGCGGRRG